MRIRKITKQEPSEPKKSRIFLKIFLALFLIVFFAISAVALRFYLECKKTVEDHLKSQTWALPSTIYADAPILYEGMPMKLARLIDYLQRLDYQPLKSSDVGAGQFNVQNFDIRFRKHTLFDDAPDEPPILVTFNKTSIEKIENASTKEDLPAYELEPIAISNLFGQEWEKRTLVKYKDLPKQMVDAVVAIEDRRFYQHGGVDLKAILRAVWNDLTNKNQLQGASTITQQLVKNFYLTPERSVRRKLREATMAYIMEKKLNKQQILELYLNEIYLGQRGAMSVNGVGEASRLYFRKDVERIDVPEAALLAGMIQAPNIYNPYRHAKEAKSRRDTVLKAMSETGAISSEEYEQYSKMPIVVYPFDSRVNLAPYFGTIVKTQLLEKYDQNSIYTKNLRIFTTLDLEMQQAAEEAIEQGLNEIDKIRFPKIKKKAEACLIAIEPQTGYIRALVGGRSFSTSQFDRVKQAMRQPGSVFKPVVYATAFEQFFQKHDRVFTPATLVDDDPWSLKFNNQVWEPKNYDGQYHGIVTLREALAHSMNIATAKLAMDVGLNPIAQLGKSLGFGDVKPYPSIALGTFEVSPWQVATAYTVFANGGVKTEIRTIKKVADTKGATLERSQIEVKKILHPQTSYLITDMLTSVLSQGTGAAVRQWGFTRPAAGKTGTTDEYRDAWFVGYTPNLLCVVWTGYDDNTPIKMTGAQAALPIWVRFMKKATENLPQDDFSSPHGVVVRMIDPTTGGLATEDCPESRPEFFIEGTEPTEPCKQHGSHWWNILG